MTDVGPLAGAVLVHAVTAFGIGGLLGGLVVTWWQRRRLEPLPEAPDSPSSDAQVPPTTPTTALWRHATPTPTHDAPRPRLTIRADPLVRGRSRAPRGPRLRRPAPTSRRCSTRPRTRRTAPTVVAVGADRDGIEGLARAERAGLPTFVHRVKDFADRADWDRALTDVGRRAPSPTWSSRPAS